jgi:hypothetical protein
MRNNVVYVNAIGILCPKRLFE